MKKRSLQPYGSLPKRAARFFFVRTKSYKYNFPSSSLLTSILQNIYDILQVLHFHHIWYAKSCIITIPAFLCFRFFISPLQPDFIFGMAKFIWKIVTNIDFFACFQNLICVSNILLKYSSISFQSMFRLV